MISKKDKKSKNSFIKLENVVKNFGEKEGLVCALNNINLELEKGQIIAILGSSGSGKSTLLNIISGMDSPTSGSVFYEGTDIAKLNDKKLTKYRRDNVSFVFQSFNLINELTVYENVELTANIKENKNIIEDSLKAVELLEKKDKYPHELSGGQQQRVSIARALAKNTDLFLCDEPTGALDYQTGKSILVELEKLNKKYKKTIIIVTHTREMGKMADRVITMKNGSVISDIINKDKISAQEVEW